LSFRARSLPVPTTLAVEIALVAFSTVALTGAAASVLRSTALMPSAA
jgi:hypothetical protein